MGGFTALGQSNVKIRLDKDLNLKQSLAFLALNIR